SRGGTTSLKGEETMADVKHRTTEELEAGLEYICGSPRDGGTLALIVRRPALRAREVVGPGGLGLCGGLVGGHRGPRGCRLTADGSAHPDMQLTVMNVRVIALVAQEPERWPLAGDELYVDLDLSQANLPPGTRLGLGSAVIEVTAEPHTGCKKFLQRFGH